MSRGDWREDIFRDDVDRQDFLKTLAEACQKTWWQAHAYCLMRNHFHLVIETPEANLVAGMRWLLSTYTIRLNQRHKLFGHVFSRVGSTLAVPKVPTRICIGGWVKNEPPTKSASGSETVKSMLLKPLQNKPNLV
jgi:hypothetical protein